MPLIIEPDPDDPGCATVMVEVTVAGRPYRLVLDTGAARSQLEADDYTSGLTPSVKTARPARSADGRPIRS